MPIDILVSLISGLAVSYIGAFAALIFSRRTKSRSQQERIEFTSKELSEIRNAINSYALFEPSNLVTNKIAFNDSDYNAVFTVLTLLNKAALAIQDGIYDEYYVEITIGNEMRMIYKKYLSVIREMRKHYENDELFLAFELLLNKWDKNKDMHGRSVLRRGRYL